MRARLSRIFRLRPLSLFNLGALTLLWSLETGVAERSALTSLLLYLPQQPFLIFSTGLLIASIARRRGKMIVFNGAVTLIFGALLLGIALPWSRLRPAQAKATPIRVMTWNVRLATGGGAALAREIKARNPDIVCLQETTGRFNSQRVVVDHTGKLFEHFDDWNVVRAGEVTTLSRYPLLQTRRYSQPAPSSRRVLSTTWQTPGGPLEVIVAHISTAAPRSRYAGRGVSSLRRLIETVENIGATARVRLQQMPVLDQALDKAQSSGHPVVLMGDFNNPPRGIFYRHLKARLTDAWTQGGAGSGFTFPAKLPLMRIDYLWISEGVRARRCFTVPTRASDHRALVGDLEVIWE